MSETTRYYPWNCYIAMAKEGVFGNNGATVGVIYAIDGFESAEIPEPMREREELTGVGEGRSVSKIVEKGYPPGDGSLSLWMVHGRWIYYALGTVTTTGVSAPYTHTITAGNTLPSCVLHTELEHSTEVESIRRDLLGCTVKSWEMSIEEKEKITQDVGLIVASSVTAADVAKPTSHTEDIYRWADVATLVIKQGSTYLISKIGSDTVTNAISSIKVKIENEIDYHTSPGNEASDYRLVGKRNVEISAHIFPQNNDLYNLRNTKVSSYANDIDFDLWIQRTATDNIRIQIDKIYLSEHPNNIASIDDKTVGIDVTFKIAPSASITATILDNLAESEAY
jgi:hypothetical protein